MCVCVCVCVCAGETCAVVAVKPSAGGLEQLPDSIPGSVAPGGLPGPQDDLSAQFFYSPPRFVMITTGGLTTLERRRYRAMSHTHTHTHTQRQLSKGHASFSSVDVSGPG